MIGTRRIHAYISRLHYLVSFCVKFPSALPDQITHTFSHGTYLQLQNSTVVDPGEGAGGRPAPRLSSSPHPLAKGLDPPLLTSIFPSASVKLSINLTILPDSILAAMRTFQYYQPIIFPNNVSVTSRSAFFFSCKTEIHTPPSKVTH